MRNIFKNLFNNNNNKIKESENNNKIEKLENEVKKLTEQNYELITNINIKNNQIEKLNKVKDNLSKQNSNDNHDEIYAINFLKYNGEIVGSSYVKTLFDWMNCQDVDIRLSPEAYKMLDKIEIYKTTTEDLGHIPYISPERRYRHETKINPIFRSEYCKKAFKGDIDIIAGERSCSASEQIYNAFMKDKERMYVFIREFESSIICDSPIKETKEDMKIVRELKQEGIKTYLELYFRLEQKYKSETGKDLIDLHRDQCYNEIITTIRTVKRYLSFFTINSDLEGVK